MTPVEGSKLTLSEVSRLLSAELASVEPKLRDELVAALAETLREPESRLRRVDRSLNEAGAYYVVHDADLNLLKDSVSAATALLPAFNPLMALPTLVALLFRYRHKRARINAEQAAVLLYLRSAPPGGCTASEIVASLSLRTPLDEERVLEVLNGLRGLRLENGERSDFVVSSGEYWTASDV